MQPNEDTGALRSINHKLSMLPEIVTQRSIFRVHKELRDINNNAYEPKLIAIGPYHHGKDDLQKMEEHKLHYLKLLLQRQQQNVDIYISAINGLEQEARNCYAEPIHLSEAEFVEMLVLDGCFIIELVRDPTRNTDPIFQTQWIRGSLVRDLILFENQIPFFVLCKLFDLIEGPDQHHMLIFHLLRFCATWGVSGRKLITAVTSGIYTIWRPKEIKHLLNLVHKGWIYSANPIVLDRRHSKGGTNFIPSATELRAANVEFRKKECDTLFEVNFKNGIMEMPLFSFGDSTECLLRNLVAYEQYFLRDKRNFVTSYVILLDSLINSSRDVEILSKCKIIDNWLGDNEAVAKIINRLTDSIVSTGSRFVYAHLFHDVNSHYEKRRNRWMAMLRRDMFYSPWAYLSFLAALTALVLTIVQTVCSIRQVV